MIKQTFAKLLLWMQIFQIYASNLEKNRGSKDLK